MSEVGAGAELQDGGLLIITTPWPCNTSFDRPPTWSSGLSLDVKGFVHSYLQTDPYEMV